MTDGTSARRSSGLPVAVMLLLVAAAWVPLYLQRRRAHQPNVDDYLYTLQSRMLAHAGSFGDLLHDFLHTGQNAPLVPLLAAPGALHGVDGAVAVELPLLLLLAGGAWLLARRWVGPWEAALIGLAAATNQAVLGWSLMMHFSVAATAFCLWTLAAYLWSDGFQRWGWSILTGVSVGLLLLSRSIAPIYAVPFVVVVAVDALISRRLRWTQVGAAIVIVLLVAGPWWLVSGDTAFHYLRTVGYEPSSGGTSSAAHLSLHSIAQRIRWTISELGPFQSLILVAAPITAVVHRRRMPGSVLVVSWLGLTLIGLATSSNVGTGFGLPLVAVAIALGGAVVFARGELAGSNASTPTNASWKRRGFVLAGILASAIVVLVVLVGAIDTNTGADLSWPVVAVFLVVVGALMTFRSIAAGLIVAVVAVGFAAELSGALSPSWFGPPYRRMALQSTSGAPAPNIDAVHREIAHAIAGRPTLLVRDDDLLNGNGLAYTASTEHLSESLVPAPFGDARAGVQALADAQLLIGGVSPVPYHHYTSTVEAAAARDGWTKIRSWNLACGNTIDLWSKTEGRSASHRRPTRSPYEAAVLADSPDVYWRLDDKHCTAEDASGHATTGTYVGHPKLGAQSLIADRDPSVHLSGKDDQVNFPASVNPSRAKAISLEAWVRPDQVPTSSGSAWQLVSKWNTALIFLTGGPRPTFVFALADPADTLYTPRVSAAVAVKPQTLYHVVGTYDGSKIRIYVNGALEGAVAYTTGLLDPNYGGALAHEGWGTLPSPRFRGSMDEVAIYGHALAPSRIETHYHVGTGAAGH